MTDHESSEMFDRSLDALLDDGVNAEGHELLGSASWLQDTFGVAGPRHSGLGARRKAAIRRRVLSARTTAPVSDTADWRHEGTLGITAGPTVIRELPRFGSLRHVAGLVAAAIVILIAIAMFGTLLRLDDNERVPGAAATASMMPFAPSSVLASPTATSAATEAVTYDAAAERGMNGRLRGESTRANQFVPCVNVEVTADAPVRISHKFGTGNVWYVIGRA
jgi:hypothetical protein